MDRLLTPAELAQVLGLAEQTIYNRIQEGRPLPPYIRLGRLLRFRASDVDAWLAALPTQTVSTRAARRRGRTGKGAHIVRTMAADIVGPEDPRPAAGGECA
ncbi:MAG: helix-turn-helix domain-containing protein [Sutterellaceae bacterium]|nr:helix-turn-helix domain-containing protein [Burkholderiaceae bacterium]MDW8429095.1 helix-turn-helix domain-containing protein [Sutterellaceae bacterium]